ncbi:iron-sulfur cluster scaffold protein nfu-related [Anaeramoeba ignava]|uniref:Iron-sulfur cluster scaffold protein nfu-related n=1 Tax=Anaeramoeba ignava TaxID=1746090 RepID=A0A9Q0RC72_ANAIG|nr:iron-sulfur cluster scaffold protein nfu-related [Anaeramoeba ignava]KAJ5078669.1 iron-sulfur cluster scaffold protein nfu-related [Anaeramoeba ignava]|eukprot:Anaeramoba_ignava/a485149_51.p1 GENE.a485149_51~~a485149_51.p1  ORF type:complete len:112 (-),score=43.66 a485149_51:47-382(-)
MEFLSKIFQTKNTKINTIVTNKLLVTPLVRYLSTSIQEEIKKVIDTKIKPGIQMDGGDVKMVGFDEKTGVLEIQLSGACSTCPMKQFTLKQGIERIMKYYVPSVKKVKEVL